MNSIRGPISPKRALKRSVQNVNNNLR